MSSYLLKISLRGTPNLVWRRFVTPSFITLGQLHDVVQKIMGWENKYAHAFYFRKQGYFPSAPERSQSQSGKILLENTAADRGEAFQKKSKLLLKDKQDGLPEEMFSLDDLAYLSGARLKYVYDPDGDKWVHEITVENIRYLNANKNSPIYCLDGVRSCPPESCGGADGFAELLKILKDSKHPQHQEYVEKFGLFQFDYFDLERINKAFNAKCPAELEWNLVVRMDSESVPKNTKKKTTKENIDPLHRLGQTLRKKAAS